MNNRFSYVPSLVPAGGLLAISLGLPALANAQEFPDPLKTYPSQIEASVFTGLGRNGYGKRPPNPFRVTLNIHSSDSRTIRRSIGSLSSVDVEYDAFTSRLLGGPTVIGFYADFNGGDRYKRELSAQTDVRIIGGGLIARRLFTESPSRSHFYVGAGAGFYMTRINIDPFGPQRYEKTGNGLGIRFQGGYQFNKIFYAQLDLLSLESLRTRNADGIPVRINPSGARFGVGYQF